MSEVQVVQRLALGLLLTAGLSACKDNATQGKSGPTDTPVTESATAPQKPAGTPNPAPSAHTTPASPVAELKNGDCLQDAPAVAKAPPPPLPLSGRLGLWVAQVDPKTLGVIKAVGTNPDSTFPLASTYKQAVLWALLRQFDQGRISPTERFEITRSNQSLGAYPFDNMTVRDLSTRMIQWSDNTATDILHRRTGLQNVQQVADDLGLCKSRFILPTRDWWVTQAGLSSTFNNTGRWAAAQGESRVKLAALIDEEAREYRPDYIQRKLDDYFDHRYQPADDLKSHNLSTPYELGTLLTHEFLKPDLSPRAVKWQRDVMQKGFGRYALKAQAAQNIEWFGGKGGNGWRILTYSGYFRTKDGKDVVYAFMQHGADQTYTMPNTRRAFAWINAGIDAVIGEQKPKPPVKPEDLKKANEAAKQGNNTATPAAKAKADAVKAAPKPLPKP